MGGEPAVVGRAADRRRGTTPCGAWRGRATRGGGAATARRDRRGARTTSVEQASGESSLPMTHRSSARSAIAPRDPGPPPNPAAIPASFDHPMSRGRRPEPSRQVFRLGACTRIGLPTLAGSGSLRSERGSTGASKATPRRRPHNLPDRSARHGGASVAEFHRLPSSRDSRRPGHDPGGPRTGGA